MMVRGKGRVYGLMNTPDDMNARSLTAMIVGAFYVLALVAAIFAVRRGWSAA
jgi:hypothetical protein